MDAQPRAACAALPAAPEAAAVSFDDVYEEWFTEVARWAGALGGPNADIDDIAQDVFLVVQRKLGDFDGRHLDRWLYAITMRVVANHRRRCWVRRVLLGEKRLERIADEGPHADEALARHETGREVWGLLARLGRKRRETFILFEIEGYSGEEIARLQGIPAGTVWTRLHHARRQFLALAAAHRARRGT